MLRGIRGAISIKENRKDLIEDGTERLIREMVMKNSIKAEDVTSVFISVTGDVTAGFPAAALRRLEGWKYVPVMCMQEIPVPGSLPLTIRVMAHVHTEQSQENIHHVYMEEAIKLRPDLTD